MPITWGILGTKSRRQWPFLLWIHLSPFLSSSNWRGPPFMGLFKLNHHFELGLLYLYLWIMNPFLSFSSKLAGFSWHEYLGPYSTAVAHQSYMKPNKKVHVPAEGKDHTGFSHPGMVTLMCNQSTGKVCLLQKNFKRSLS